MENKRVNTKILYLLKTEEGYLHHDVYEGLYLEEGEVNYSFTDDPFQAYNFYRFDGLVPKYLDYTWEVHVETLDEACKILNGKIVQVKVSESIEWEEIEAGSEKHGEGT